MPACRHDGPGRGHAQRPLSRQYAARAAAFGYTPPSTDLFDRKTDLDAQINLRQEIGGACAGRELEPRPGDADLGSPHGAIGTGSRRTIAISPGC